MVHLTLAMWSLRLSLRPLLGLEVRFGNKNEARKTSYGTVDRKQT